MIHSFCAFLTVLFIISVTSSPLTLVDSNINSNPVDVVDSSGDVNSVDVTNDPSHVSCNRDVSTANLLDEFTESDQDTDISDGSTESDQDHVKIVKKDETFCPAPQAQGIGRFFGGKSPQTIPSSDSSTTQPTGNETPKPICTDPGKQLLLTCAAPEVWDGQSLIKVLDCVRGQ